MTSKEWAVKAAELRLKVDHLKATNCAGQSADEQAAGFAALYLAEAELRITIEHIAETLRMERFPARQSDDQTAQMLARLRHT